MTPEERWFRRLTRCLRDMPDNVELQVHHGTIQMNEAGARDRAFEERGDADNVEEIASARTRRVHPCSESL